MQRCFQTHRRKLGVDIYTNKKIISLNANKGPRVTSDPLEPNFINVDHVYMLQATVLLLG